MGCNCRSNTVAGTTTQSGTVRGYEVTYTDGTKAPNLFNTPVDAKVHVRAKGGGTIRKVVSE